jgi:mono/diheme cytochrome c family protein
MRLDHNKSMKLAPIGTIPRGREVYLYTDAVVAGQELINPLSSNKQVLETGKRYYNIYCLPCHGAYGAGDGNVIKLASLQQRMPKPPELYTAKLMAYPDGQLYHILTVGQGNMPGYASRISPNTRWAIVNYVRALQEASKIQ